MKRIGVGIVGFGTVGGGVAGILLDSEEVLAARLGVKLRLVRVADTDLESDRGVTLPEGTLTGDVSRVLEGGDVDIVVETVGGCEAAKSFVLRALAAGKPVVTANKALLALHGAEVFGAARKAGLDLGYEAAVAGGVPIIRALKEGLAANRFQAVYGIMNGTCNYILTEMTREGRPFDEVLKEAQEAGYAEADPAFDVEGIDAAHKLAILSSIAFGAKVPFDAVFAEGIGRVIPMDIELARLFGYTIKLLAITKLDGGKIEARVHPTMVPTNHLLAKVDGAMNAVYVVGDVTGPTLYYGAGAGRMPTAGAIVSDLAEIARNIVAGSPRRVPPLGRDEDLLAEIPVRPMDDLVSHYYLRFSVVDRPGVLAAIAGALAERKISIYRMIQGRPFENGDVPVVMLLHWARERDVRRALEEIDEMDFIRAKTVLIRIEDEQAE